MILSFGLIIEAITVGVVMMFLGPFIPSNFLLGVIVHLLFEYIGANKWYCKNGNACKEKQEKQEKQEPELEGYPSGGWIM